jgi:hypothetical protein
MIARLSETVRTVAWILCTGGLWSPLRSLPESQPFRVVRTGRQLSVEPIPTYHTEVPYWYQVGQRVVVLPHAGFHRGAHGVVAYHAGDAKVWVRRDGAGSDAYYLPHEIRLEKDEEHPAVAYPIERCECGRVK